MKENIMEEVSKQKGISTGALIGVAVIVAIAFGGGSYAYVSQKAAKEKKVLNAQITELQKQVSSSKTATSTTSKVAASATVSATDETANWKTYTNDKYGFSFKYPSAYTATDDLEKNTTSAPAKKLTTKSDTSTMELYVNSDGFGPFFPDVRYAMEYTGGKINSTKTTSSDENSTDNRTLAMGNLTVAPNSYLFFFYTEGSDTKPLTEFDKILTTFKFTK